MEEMDALFSRPWYMGWKAHVTPVHRRAQVDDEKHMASANEKELGSSTPRDQQRSTFE